MGEEGRIESKAENFEITVKKHLEEKEVIFMATPKKVKYELYIEKIEN